MFVFINILSVLPGQATVLSGNGNNTDSLESDDSVAVVEVEELCPSEPTEKLNLRQLPEFPLDGLFYIERYTETDLLYKVTDNWGNGYEDLYGTRNMRAVLHGVAYRGGGNNYYHNSDKRDNHNPLPDDGIMNLCEEGFSAGVYLYRTNTETAPGYQWCDCIGGNENFLVYEQYDYFDNDHIYEMLKLVYESATDNTVGPVYLHCWNGWHASGLISAIILRQFCGYSAQDAINYWDLGTDGSNTSPRYNSIRDDIREFEPYEEFMITDSLGNLICVDMPEVIDYEQLFIDIESLVLVPEAIPVGYSITLTNVTFGPNKTSFSDADNNRDLILLFEAMEIHEDITIEIEGHTDNTGNYNDNMALSQQRAQFVYNWLIGKGISADRVTFSGFSSSKPKFSNSTSDGRAANRRIDITIVSKNEQPADKLVDEDK